MKAFFILSLFTVLFSGHAKAQQIDPDNFSSTPYYLETLFQSDLTFTEITEQADEFFRNKYPNKSNLELSQGEFRDGDYVKYQRWKSFWQNHLDDNGKIYWPTEQPSLKGQKSVSCSGNEYQANWANVNYNSNMGWQIDQGRTSAMAFHPTNPDIFYVGASFGGLWRTDNGGGSYTLINDDLPLAAISGIVIDPNNPDHMVISLSDIVWYGPPGLGIYSSTDGGQTFTPTSTAWSLTDDVKIYYMDQDPNNPNNIIIATSDGIFKTTDFFATSYLVTAGDMRSVKYSRSTNNLVFAGGAHGQFYRSTDGGENFSFVADFGSGQVRIAVPLLAGSSNVVATHESSLERSTDNGQTFDTQTLPESNMVIEFMPGSETVLNAGNFEVYRSDDFGANFTALTHWYGDAGLPFIHVDQRNVFVNPIESDNVYFCNDGGITRYDNTLDQFANLSADLIITQYYDIAVSQSDPLVLGAGSQDNGNVFRESNGNWYSYAPTGDGMGQEIDPANAGRRYWSYQFGGVNRWENNSNTYIAPPGEGGNGAWETPFKVDPNNSDRLLIGYESVYSSNDNGDTWATIGGVVSSGADLEQLAIAPSNSDQIYVTQGSNFWVKEAGSASWTSHLTPSGQRITDLEVDPLNEDVVYICYSGYTDGSKVYRSDDAGANWTNITGSLPNLPVMSLELYENQPGGIFIGTYGSVYYMDDSQSNWIEFGCLPNTSVHDIEIQYFTNRIYIGTHGRGIFSADIQFEFASNEEAEFESEETLAVFPNPTNNSATIVGAINKEDITIVDLTGREQNAGITKVNEGYLIDCKNLSNGIYFVNATAKNGTQSTLRLVVEK